ncbi:MAG: hypothetical protein ACI9TI_002575, partial [Natronomonas sp.]
MVEAGRRGGSLPTGACLYTPSARIDGMLDREEARVNYETSQELM